MKFAATWTNEQAARVGYWLGRGKTPTEVAEILDDGTKAHTVTRMRGKWGLPTDKVGLDLTSAQRKKLAAKAKALGIDPDEYVRRIMVCVVEDKHDLYQAITDGAYD